MTIHISRPKDKLDRKKLYRFLYEIWSEEFNRNMEGMDHEQRVMIDSLDETARHLIAFDQSGKIVGCVRANTLEKSILSEELQNQLKIPALTSIFSDRELCYVSHFAVAPDARGRTVASLLIAALYRLSLEDGIQIGISYCSLHFLSFYYQLGYRPYTENFRLDAGVRVPIVHCIRDRTYLEKINSPLCRLCPKVEDDRGAAAERLTAKFHGFKDPCFARSKPHHLWARLARTVPNKASADKNTLLGELTEEEYRIVSQRASEISFAQGEYVYQRGEKERGMGVLLKGSLGVEILVGETERIINVILPGEPIGEIGSLGRGRRTAGLVALEESQVIILPFDFIERLSGANPALGLKVSHRLLRTIANRFVNLADIIACSTDLPSVKQQFKRPFHFQRVGTDDLNDRVESYRFESLGDLEGEFRRLITQATIGEDVEFGVLEDLGLRNSSRVLDLGSGPGVTTLLMARRLTTATIFGVEPEDMLRSTAETLVESQGLAERCRFLKGMGDRIPLDDGIMDFCYARLLFQHLPNPLEVLAEMRRVTRPGGRIVILDVDDSTNTIFPAPEGLGELEQRIIRAQAAAGGDRNVGRKLHGYLHEAGLREVGVDHIPITAAALGRQPFFSIVYSFKKQVLERSGELDDTSRALFKELEAIILRPTTFAMTTVFVAHGTVP